MIICHFRSFWQTQIFYSEDLSEIHSRKCISLLRWNGTASGGAERKNSQPSDKTLSHRRCRHSPTTWGWLWLCKNQKICILQGRRRKNLIIKMIQREFVAYFLILCRACFLITDVFASGSHRWNLSNIDSARVFFARARTKCNVISWYTLYRSFVGLTFPD